MVNLGIGQSVINTAHNLSVSVSNPLKSINEEEVCFFCHTPHSSKPRISLWNKRNSGVMYMPYTSSTIKSAPGQPNGSAVLCLSCHDGTIALGSVVSRDEDAWATEAL